MTVVEGWFHGRKFAKAPERGELVDSVASKFILNAALNSKVSKRGHVYSDGVLSGIFA